MRTHQLRPCATPRCREWTMMRHCPEHLTERERDLRTALDAAVVTFASAEEAYVAAVKADHPLTVVETLRAYTDAYTELHLVETGLGMGR